MKKKVSSIRPEECLFYICVCLSRLYKYLSSWLQSPLFFIFKNKSSSSYTWRAEITFLGLLSHPEHTSKLLPCNLGCATTVYGHFLINGTRGVVVLYLMRRRWLLHHLKTSYNKDTTIWC